MKTYCVANPLFRNEEIKPLQTALKAAKLYGGPVDGTFGSGTGDGCYRAKYRLGYPMSAVNHCGGQQLLNYLNGTDALPLAFKLRRHARGYGISAGDRMCERIVYYARWGALNSPSIHYAQVRPMDHLNRVQALPWTTDCSEFVTTIFKWAGAPDPNGRGFDGLGYTGTMLDHGVTIPLFQVRKGDVVIWGSFPGHHTAVFVEDGSSGDPLIVSHGSERGPLEVRLSQENAAQRGRLPVFKRYLPS